MKRLIPMCVVVLLVAAPGLFADEYIHPYNSPYGDWHDVQAWTPLDGAPVAVPGSTDVAHVEWGINLNSDAQIGTLDVDPYYLWGTYNLTLNNSTLTIADGGQWQWGGITEAGTGPSTINSHGTFTLVDDIDDHFTVTPYIDAIEHHIHNDVTWNNYGTIRHEAAGFLALGSASTQLNNHNTYDFADDGDITTGGSGGRLDNYGTIVKTAGTGESYINADLANHGTIESQTGNIAVNNSLDHTSSATHELLNGQWIARDEASIVITARGVLQTIEAPAQVVLDGATAGFFTTQTSIYTPIENSLTTIHGTLEVYGDRTFANTLSVDGSLVIGDSTTLTAIVSNAGNMAIGNSPGIATIDGDYTQTAGGVMQVELGGTGSGGFDVLNVTGTATLDGMLDLTYWDTFTAQVGDSFVILTAGDLTGTFANVVLPDAKIWDINYDFNADTVTLTVTEVPDPASLAMGLAGLGLVAARRRR